MHIHAARASYRVARPAVQSIAPQAALCEAIKPIQP